MSSVQNFPNIEAKLIAVKSETMGTETPKVISAKTTEFRPVLFTGKNGETKINYRHRNASTESKRTATENYLSIVDPLFAYLSIETDANIVYVAPFADIENFTLGQTFTVIVSEKTSEFTENVSVDVMVSDAENGKFKYSIKVYSPVEKVEKAVFSIDEEEALELENLIMSFTSV